MIENRCPEIIRGSRKYIVGGIYRHTKQNIDQLNNLLDNCFSVIQKIKSHVSFQEILILT